MFAKLQVANDSFKISNALFEFRHKYSFQIIVVAFR
nr:MAG TPA: hypothetical protein [Caudoviricetes sp.]DAV81334.1 MAG TPA: hypothetical protein [Caudoviricetes sp.]